MVIENEEMSIDDVWSFRTSEACSTATTSSIVSPHNEIAAVAIKTKSEGAALTKWNRFNTVSEPDFQTLPNSMKHFYYWFQTGFLGM